MYMQTMPIACTSVATARTVDTVLQIQTIQRHTDHSTARDSHFNGNFFAGVSIVTYIIDVLNPFSSLLNIATNHPAL
jgi:hypothetical protein